MAGSSRQHRLGLEQALKEIEGLATPFDPADGAAREARMRLDLLGWCRTYLPHYFDCEFAPFHRRMMDAAGEPGMPTFVCAVRGAGKSVLLTLARPLRQALEGGTPYLIYGSQVQKLAAQNMDGGRREVERNPRSRGDDGEVEVSGLQTAWTLHRPTTGHSTRFEAFGIGMSPRGRRHGEHRPTEFVGDDLENAELARNPDREQNLWDWLMDEVVPAMEPERFAFTVLGTMFGPRCMMERARRLVEVKDRAGRPLARLFVQAAGEEGRSVWPERFGDETLARVRATIGLRNWLRNYALSADDPSKPFQAAWLGTYRPQDVDAAGLDVVAFLDPAVTQSARGCPRALVAVGADRASGTRYVLGAWIARGTPVEMIRKLFAFARAYRPRVIGIESNGGFALIKSLLAMWEERRRQRLPVRYVNHTRPKDLRIESLCSAFEIGRWLFPQNPGPGVRTLQDQLLSYPNGFVDGPDAMAGGDELLPPAFAPAADAGKAYRGIERRTDYAGL